MTSIPTCLGLAVLLFWPLGFSINSSTLVGLLLAIGRLVDDSIVVIHAIHRRMQHGENAAEAAVRGTMDVILPIAAATGVMALAIIPLLVSGGITQIMFTGLVWPIVFALLPCMAKLEYRPVAQPHMGGHIERLLGTLMGALHELPGATFSSPKQRGNYDSDTRAVMALREVERWLTEYIVGVYHAKQHRGIQTSPLQRWTAGVIGDPETGGASRQRRPNDDQRFGWTFCRSLSAPFSRTVSRSMGSGTTAMCCGALLVPPKTGTSAASCFAATPRDISTIYFWDPEVRQYSAIPYRNTTYPPLSVWELRELRRTLSASGAAPIDEAAIFAAHARLREHEARAVTETKRARRVRVRRPAGGAIAMPSDPEAPEPETALSSAEDIVPFAIEKL
jgi:hypothetical protein